MNILKHWLSVDYFIDRALIWLLRNVFICVPQQTWTRNLRLQANYPTVSGQNKHFYRKQPCYATNKYGLHLMSFEPDVQAMNISLANFIHRMLLGIFIINIAKANSTLI